MIVLYLASSTSGSGKTTVASGLGKHFIRQNKKVGYFKPVIAGLPAENLDGNTDVTLMRRLLSLEETEEALSPVFADETTLMSDIMLAFVRAAKCKDIVLMEGVTGTGQFVSGLADMFSAKVIGVEAYATDYTKIAPYYQVIGKRLVGIIINKVPVRRLTKVVEDFSQTVNAKVLGLVPEERALTSMTVADLAKEINGEIVSGKDNANAIIENIMIGAMVPDHSEQYYGLKKNKAVIVRSERSDMQLAALETSTTCLVLAGKSRPIPMVRVRAEEKHVPIIVTGDSIIGVTANVERAMREARLSAEKLKCAAETVEKHIKFDEIEKLWSQPLSKSP